MRAVGGVVDVRERVCEIWGLIEGVGMGVMWCVVLIVGVLDWEGTVLQYQV